MVKHGKLPVIIGGDRTTVGLVVSANVWLALNALPARGDLVHAQW